MTDDLNKLLFPTPQESRFPLAAISPLEPARWARGLKAVVGRMLPLVEEEEGEGEGEGEEEGEEEYIKQFR